MTSDSREWYYLNRVTTDVREKRGTILIQKLIFRMGMYLGERLSSNVPCVKVEHFSSNIPYLGFPRHKSPYIYLRVRGFTLVHSDISVGEKQRKEIILAQSVV